jgi:transketolase C-terminal domain/subunit
VLSSSSPEFFIIANRAVKPIDKKNTLLMLPLGAVFSFSSYDQDNGIGCAIAEVRFSCTSDNPYRLCINTPFKTNIQGNSFVDVELEEGFQFRMEQVSGFLLFPPSRKPK